MQLGGQLLCGDLIGRDSDLRDLTGALHALATGVSTTSVLVGEPGIGKTRLAKVLLDRARTVGARILECPVHRVASTVPCAPIVSSLQHAVGCLTTKQRHQLHSRLRSPLVSDMLLGTEASSHHATDLSSPGTPETFSVDPQHAMFEGFTQAIEILGELLSSTDGAAQCNGLVLLIDDLQWSDRGTIAYVRYLAQYLDRAVSPNVRSAGTLLLLACREPNEQEDSEAAALICELVSQRRARLYPLGPLTEPAHRQMIECILGQPVEDALADVVLAHSDGVPLAVEELLGALRFAGEIYLEGNRVRLRTHAQIHIPLTLSASVIDRLSRVSKTARQVLEVAAIIGREFEFDLLARLTGLDETPLIAVLHEARRAQLVSEKAIEDVPASDDWYRFRHELTRDAILADLLRRERRAVHQRVAEELSRGGCGDFGRVAEHYRQANLPEKAIEFGLREVNERGRSGMGQKAAAEFREHRDSRSVPEVRFPVALTSIPRRRRCAATPVTGIAALTARETQVMRLLAEGRTNRQVAVALCIAEGTAELHVSRVLGKLGCGTRTQVAVLAAREQWLEPLLASLTVAAARI